MIKNNPKMVSVVHEKYQSRQFKLTEINRGKFRTCTTVWPAPSPSRYTIFDK